MSSETVEIVGVSDSYANDTATGADLNDVRVIYNGTELVKGTYYTISAADGNFTITFTGNYSGEQTKPYTLNNKFTATSDSLTVTYDGNVVARTTSLSAVKDSVKALTVGGVAPSEETELAGTYTIQRPFVLATRTGEALSEAAQAFFRSEARRVGKECRSRWSPNH